MRKGEYWLTSPFATKLAFTICLSSGPNGSEKCAKAHISFRVSSKKVISVTIVPGVRDVKGLRVSNIRKMNAHINKLKSDYLTLPELDLLCLWLEECRIPVFHSNKKRARWVRLFPIFHNLFPCTLSKVSAQFGDSMLDWLTTQPL